MVTMASIRIRQHPDPLAHLFEIVERQHLREIRQHVLALPLQRETTTLVREQTTDLSYLALTELTIGQPARPLRQPSSIRAVDTMVAASRRELFDTA